jgi:hypothetical protein
MKSVLIIAFLFFTVSLLFSNLNAQCTNVTLTMNDSFGDGWNGGSISFISQCDGTVYGPYDIAGSTGTEVITFPDGDYDITMVPGSYPGEITWSLDIGVTGTGNSGTITNAFTLGAGCPGGGGRSCCDQSLKKRLAWSRTNFHKYMRFTQEEKYEIIRIVEDSELGPRNCFFESIY